MSQDKSKKKVTILIPCYNEKDSLHPLYDALKSLMDDNASYDWEVLLINDGSKDSRVGYVNLSRNFGKECAMLAGFDHASGDCTVIMDADLQHPPHVIPQMLEKWEEGYQDVMVKSEVLATTDKYFALKLICYQGAGSGAEWNYFYTVDLDSGKRIALKDLFVDGADYIDIISENIKEQMREQMKNYLDDAQRLRSELNELKKELAKQKKKNA